MLISKTKKNTFKQLLLFALVFCTLLPALFAFQPVNAASKAATDINEQHRRTLMEGFKYCLLNQLSTDIRDDDHAADVLNNLDIFETEVYAGGGRGRDISVGHEIEPDGNIVCANFDSSVIDLGYSDNMDFVDDIYEKKGTWSCNTASIVVDCYKLNGDKLSDVIANKVDPYINDRGPINNAEKIRRLRYAFETKCATPNAGDITSNPQDNPQDFVEISGNWFKYDKNTPTSWISIGHDMQGDRGENMCQGIARDLKNLDAYNPEAYAKALCEAEGKTNDQACIDSKKGQIPVPGSSGANANAEKEKPTCEVKLDSPLSWLMCPILNLADRLINRFIEDTIFKRLEFTFDDEGANAKEVWRGFRTLANIVFIIAFLVAIFGQATSFIDAYTIKKMLPRLVIAAILIQLSFVLCELMVNITNVLGKGVGDLIAAPFGGTGQLQVNVGKISGAGQGQLFGIVLAGAIAGFFGAFSLLGLAMAAFFGVIGALITIVFRESILFLLIVVSPVALVLWTLPNVDKYAKMWFSLFAKTLLMYPLIVAFITIGKALGSGKLVTVVDSQAKMDAAGGGQPTSMLDTLFTTIAHAADAPPKDNGALDAIVAVILYFGPIFLIPFTFKFAGGAIATIGGFTGKMGQGMVAGAKKRAQMKGAQRRAMTGANIQAGQIPKWMGGNTATGKKFGRGMGALRAGPGGWVRKGGISASMEAGQIKRAALGAETEEMQAIATNDKAQALLARAGNASEAKRIMEKYIEEHGEGSRATWEQAHALAARAGYGNTGARRQAYDMWTKSGYNLAAGEEGYDQMKEAASSIAGGNKRMMGNIMNQGQYNAKGAGRLDVGGVNNGETYDFEKSLEKVTDYGLGQARKETHETMVSHAKEYYSRGDYEGARKILTRLSRASSTGTGAAAGVFDGFKTSEDGSKMLKELFTEGGDAGFVGQESNSPTDRRTARDTANGFNMPSGPNIPEEERAENRPPEG